ncbi:hypothetical protein AURDEDRAFT_156373 [Auricularia subglabra TFB-10046 SS5]|nr:hypothetical protein AURDEDRAFT_156373 [Auricularia subglabra TFB-10046 SS5]
MRSTASLPPNLHDQLNRALADIYDQAWDALGGLDVEETVLETARACLASAARRKHDGQAQLARQENNRSSWMSRLPNELWDLVFEQLPFDDFFAATHACSAWRARALASPHLWTRPTFYSYDCGRGIANVEAAPFVLARSGQLPLDVTLEDHATLRCVTRFIALACALYPHTARIRRLCVRSGHIDVPYMLLVRLPALPTLGVLVVQRLPTQKDGHYLTFPFCPENFDLNLPKLAHLELDRGYVWPEKYPCAISTIRSLRLTPRKHLNVEIGAALEGCPNLERLHLNLSDFASVEEPLPADAVVRPRAASLASVIISGATSNDFLADWVRAMFHDHGRREFRIEHSGGGGYPGWDILCDVFTPGAAVILKVGYSRDKLFTACAIGDGGRVRGITMYDCDESSAPLSALAHVVERAGADCKLTLEADEFCASHLVLSC